MCPSNPSRKARGFSITLPGPAYTRAAVSLHAPAETASRYNWNHGCGAGAFSSHTRARNASRSTHISHITSNVPAQLRNRCRTRTRPPAGSSRASSNSLDARHSSSASPVTRTRRPRKNSRRCAAQESHRSVQQAARARPKPHFAPVRRAQQPGVPARGRKGRGLGCVARHDGRLGPLRFARPIARFQSQPDTRSGVPRQVHGGLLEAASLRLTLEHRGELATRKRRGFHFERAAAGHCELQPQGRHLRAGPADIPPPPPPPFPASKAAAAPASSRSLRALPRSPPARHIESRFPRRTPRGRPPRLRRPCFGSPRVSRRTGMRHSPSVPPFGIGTGLHSAGSFGRGEVRDAGLHHHYRMRHQLLPAPLEFRVHVDGIVCVVGRRRKAQRELLPQAAMRSDSEGRQVPRARPSNRRSPPCAACRQSRGRPRSAGSREPRTARPRAPGRRIRPPRTRLPPAAASAQSVVPPCRSADYKRRLPSQRAKAELQPRCLSWH